MTSNQPFHLYLLNQQPRKSILKTSAAQASPKIAKTATFHPKEISPHQNPSLPNHQIVPSSTSSSDSFSNSIAQNPVSKIPETKPAIGTTPHAPLSFSQILFPNSSVQALNDCVQTVYPSSKLNSPHLVNSWTSSTSSEYYYKPSPSPLFQSLIIDSLLSSEDEQSGNSTVDGNHSAETSSISFSHPQSLLHSNVGGASPSSIQKETTKMSQQRTGTLSASEANLSHHSLINGGVVGLSNQANMFKKDYSKAIRQFQNQTTNQFIQRTIASNLDNIQKNRPNVASDRTFLEGMELGMQLNGFLNKLTRDSKDYIKELLDDAVRTYEKSSVISTTQQQISTGGSSPIDPFIQSSVQNMMQKSQENAFPTLFVRKCMQEAVSKTQQQH